MRINNVKFLNNSFGSQSTKASVNKVAEDLVAIFVVTTPNLISQAPSPLVYNSYVILRKDEIQELSFDIWG